MTRRLRLGLAYPIVAFALACLGACGNYSNDDLEFMDAIPAQNETTVELPLRPAAVLPSAADGWRQTLEVSRTFNATAVGLLTLVDRIRSNYPTTRNSQTRIWGPYPAEDNPGWQVEFSMTKDPALNRFEYRLEMIPPAGVTLALGGSRTLVLAGRFDTSGAAKVGQGHVELSPGEARLAGVAFKGLDRLQMLVLDYDTRGLAQSIDMTLDYDPPADPVMDVARAAYHYRRDQTGLHDMQFDADKDIVPGPAGVDTMHIQSRWQADGQGREDISITAGDGAGVAMAAECWNTRFQSTFKSLSWSPPAVGDPATCIVSAAM